MCVHPWLFSWLCLLWFNNTMQEDQPNFKVTDRRLFNADGSPRDLPPEEKPKPAAAVTPEAAATAPATEAQATPEREVSASAAAPETPAAPQESSEAEEEFTEEDLADARDPASFVSFLMSIASNAASALGMMEHPVTHQREVDVEL